MTTPVPPQSRRRRRRQAPSEQARTTIRFAPTPRPAPAPEISPRRPMIGDAGECERERGEKPAAQAPSWRRSNCRGSRRAPCRPMQRRGAGPIGRPSLRSIRAPSAFMRMSTTPPRNPADDQGDRDPSFAWGIQQRAQRRAKEDRRDGERPLDAEAMRKRTARRHGDEIGAGVDGQEDAERGRVNAGADQNRAGGAAQGRPRRRRRRTPRRPRHARARLRESPGGARSAQNSVGAPPSALRRATKAVSASRRSASSGGEPIIRFPRVGWTAAQKRRRDLPLATF